MDNKESYTSGSPRRNSERPSPPPPPSASVVVPISNNEKSFLEERRELSKEILTNIEMTKASVPKQEYSNSIENRRPFQEYPVEIKTISHEKVQVQEKKKEKVLDEEEIRDKINDLFFQYEHIHGHPKKRNSMSDANNDLDIVKAKTLFNLVEDIKINSGDKKLLFLTNQQARVLTNSKEDIIPKLLGLLTEDHAPPKLFIEIIHSRGATYVGDKEYFNRPPPFNSATERIESESNLVSFMQNVIIPLAAENHAIILLQARAAGGRPCDATLAFLKALSLEQCKWVGNHIPFTIVGWMDASSLPLLYRNTKEDAVWKQLRDNSTAWKSREPIIKEMMLKDKSVYNEVLIHNSFDIHESVPIIIICDGINEVAGKFRDNTAMSDLMTEICRPLAASYPNIALKFGCTREWESNELLFSNFHSCWDYVVSKVKSGAPVLLLDTKKRIFPTKILVKDEKVSLRKQWIEICKESFVESCNRLTRNDKLEYFDADSLAYFWRVMFAPIPLENLPPSEDDSGRNARQHLNSSDVENPINEKKKNTIWYAIEKVIDDAKEISGDKAPANSKLVGETCIWLASFLFKMRWTSGNDLGRVSKAFRAEGTAKLEKINNKSKKIDEGHPEYEDEQHENENDTAVEIWGSIISDYASRMETAVSNSQCFASDISDQRQLDKLVRRLTMKTRLPKDESLEGLKMIVQAWKDFDITMHLADYYKRLSKVLYVVILFFGIAIVAIANVQAVGDSFLDENFSASWAPRVVFFLNITNSFLLSVSVFLDPTNKWHTLRSSACQVESIIWCYRTRVGEFSVDISDDNSDEKALFDALSSWRQTLSAATDLNTTTLQKEYPDSIYKHHQVKPTYNAYKNSQINENDDDYYSPTNAADYIKLRLSVKKKFYQGRIPTLVRVRLIYQVLVFLSSAICAILSSYSLTTSVVIITSISAAITSWIQYRDLNRKVERFTRSVSLITWDSLGPIEKNLPSNIAMLVLNGESILISEPRAWAASVTKPQNDKSENSNNNDNNINNNDKKDN